MVTLLEKARGMHLRAVRCFGHDDRFLVWQPGTPNVVETTLTTCTCDLVSCRDGCPHLGFVRELIARDVPAMHPVWVEELQRLHPAPKLPADGRTTSRYIGVTWCAVTGKWLASLMIAGKHYRIGRFDREEDAARAYDWATYHRPDLETRRKGKRPRFNFPDELPPAPPAIKPSAAIFDVLNAA